MIIKVTIGLYFVLLVILGIVGYKRTKAESITDMFIADGKLSSVIVFITSCATCFSAFAFLGAPSYFYSSGVTSVLYMAPIAADLTLMCLIGRGLWLLGKRHRFVTPADLLSARYDYKNDKTVKLIAGVACLFFSIFYIQLNFTGSAYVMNTVTDGDIPYRAAVIIIAVFIGFYTIMGGMRSVAWSDAIQAILLFAALGAICIIAFSKAGGAELFQNVLGADPQFDTLNISPVYAYTCILGVAISMPVWPTMWQRCYTGRNLKGTVIGFVQGEAVGVFFLCIIFPAIVGGAGLLLWPNLEGLMTDRVTIMFFEFVPPVLAGLFAIGAMSAAMSTADALTLLLGSIVIKDILFVFKKDYTEKQVEWISRSICMLIVVISVIIALNPPDKLVAIAFSLAWPGAACMFPLVVGAIFWKRATREGGIAGLIMAYSAVIVTTVIWPDALGVYSAIWGVVAGFVGLIVVSYLTPPPPQEIVEKFHGFLKASYKYKGIRDVDDVNAITPEKLTN